MALFNWTFSKPFLGYLLQTQRSILTLYQNKFLDWSKLKELADDKINVTEKLKFVFGRVENMWDKEKMLVTSIFSISYSVFKRLLSQSL